MTIWAEWRKCPVCTAGIGTACRSLSGTVAAGQPDGIVTALLRPHLARKMRAGVARARGE